MTTVFVYGTLKRGHGLSNLLTGQQFLGIAHTTPHFRMAALADGSYPGLYQSPSNGLSIEGELWSVSPDCLAGLDRAEGVAEGLYSRNVIGLLPPHENLTAEAYHFLGEVSGLPDAGSRW